MRHFQIGKMQSLNVVFNLLDLFNLDLSGKISCFATLNSIVLGIQFEIKSEIYIRSVISIIAKFHNVDFVLLHIVVLKKS